MRKRISLILLALLVQTLAAQAQIKSFPQAEGFGATATGGRGGDVYHVTNLTDVGVGSLRYGIENAPVAGRTIVFDVGGWITLTDKLGLTKNKVTIAGQTAPGGIGIRDDQFSVGGDDVIVRHMRFRPGRAATAVGSTDSINTNENAQRVIYDHISAEFSTDGGFDLQADLVTLQYSSVSFGILTHSTGGLIQSPTGGAAGELTFHHNMFAHNQTRNPKARAELIDWRDNVIYNYHDGFIAGDSETNVEPNWRANFDGNTYISNIGGNASSGGRPMMTGGRTVNYDLWYGTNSLDRDSDAVANPVVYSQAQAMANQSIVSSQYNWSATPFTAPSVWQNTTPGQAQNRVLQEFGATPWARDAVNQLIYNQVTSRTGVRINHENTLGIANAGYPDLNPNNLPTPTDTDQDGMPDAWETKYNTDPAIANNNGDFDNDGYTDLEEYLNDTAAFKAIGALEFDGAGRYADWSNWTRSWEPSKHDEVQINAGSAVVDAVGQKAGSLRLGTLAGFPSATLLVNSGWLEITHSLEVGVASDGFVSQQGGTVRILGDVGVYIGTGTYTMQGGELFTPRISHAGMVGGFGLNGGTLHAGVVGFTLFNNGGVISPGESPGSTHIQGDLVMTSGSILLELAGIDPTEYDQIIVDGTLHAGGTLNVVLDDFNPSEGDSFDLFDFAAAQGSFSLNLPTLSGNLEWDTSALLTTGTLAVVSTIVEDADFDGDGDVDGRDFLIWQRGYGLTGQEDNSQGDADGDGSVDGEDLGIWQVQYGQVPELEAQTSVPEPGTLLLTSLWLLVYFSRR